MRALLHRLFAALFAATLGGACGSEGARPGMPKHNDEPRHARAGSEHGDVGPHGAHHGAEMDHRFSGADKWTRILDDPARDAWQRPDDVLRALELTPAMTVADVGAGTGYFAVRLARAVPEGQVIATDVEVDMVRHLEARARRERLPNLRAVRATDAVSGLAANSVDRILVVHVWHHLADRRAFARGLAAALRPGGKTVVVDFNLGAERGPPPNLRLPPEAITGDLAAAGLTAKVSAVALPDQYLVEARRGP